jgi:hypothetical protein
MNDINSIPYPKSLDDRIDWTDAILDYAMRLVIQEGKDKEEKASNNKK